MKRSAFSLIELIIVVVIMGIIYSLAVTNFQTIDVHKVNINLKNLKKYLVSIPHESKVELICLDNCESCKVYVDSEINDDNNEFSNVLDDSIKIYRYDFYTGLQEKEQKTFFNDENIEENICFSYSIDKNGVGDQMIVEFKNKIYDFTPYFDYVKIYHSLNEVTDAKEKLFLDIQR